MSEAKDVPIGWTIAAIKDFATTATGGTPSRLRSDYFGGEVPWVKSGELGDGIVYDVDESLTQLGVDESNAKVFPKGTLCIALYGATVGKLGVLGMDATTNQAVCGIFLPDEIDTKYVFHFLASIRRELIEMGKGGAQSNISNGIVRETRVPLAPPNEQRRIVGKIEELFSDLEAGVAALTRARANLKRYRASVLKAAVEGALTAEWRTQHPRSARVSDPAAPTDRRSHLPAAPDRQTQRGDLRSDHSAGSGDPRTARHPQVEPASKLLERILTERRRQWEADQLTKFAAAGKQPPNNWQARYAEPSPPDTTNLPTLPDGWCWVRLSHVAFFQNGHAFPSKEYCDEGVKLLRPGNLIDDGTVRWTDKNTRCLPAKWADENSAYIIRGGELVMNLTAQSLKDEFLGRTCITDDDDCCLLNQRLARITPVSAIAPRFLLVLLKSKLFRRFVNSLNSGSLIQHMFTSQLDEFVMPLPPLTEQAEIVATVSEKLSQIESAEVAIEHSLRRAARLRQSILKQAFEGKLVPQDPTDEPASTLLADLRSNQPESVGARNSHKKRRTSDV